MKNRLICAVLMITALPSLCLAAEKCAEQAKPAFKPGMKVIAALAGPNWQVAKVDSVKGGRIEVTFPDGGKGSVGSNELAPLPSDTPPCFRQGDKVIAKAEKDIWRTAKIGEVKDEGAVVIFMDKKKQTKKFSEIARYPK
ncbi:MAG: hypothetical protein WC956_08060 [bacterium]